ncbi:thioredoxin-like protein [Fomitiporia mediterranea MF3/22]|uniref:thioredoxin-like protein n=1 Tax=Fomitiporia mediterranea (strain MF3/22) TaxID=694068 RepID=UPI000440803D|nr:thioredoxin-like protein [Fomitiporia mediterranea MF3/22]EJD07845.1 thioredoxin-like protein [Fomitiporia mediterranea MF3/22]
MSTTTTATSGVDTPAKIKIDVTSDSICPFCFIGKRKLDRAIEMAKEKGLNADFEVEFLPFLLDPTLKEDEPVSKKLRYEQKFGKERFDSMEAAMIERGKLNGINFSYGGNVRQTTDSHRLLTLAYEKRGQIMQADLVEKMFSGYFEQEQDIGDRDYLTTQAVAAGLFSSVEEAKNWLATDAKKEEVQQGILKAQAMGISGVPFFVFNNKFAISGAEDSELFVQVFERILGEARAPSKPVSTGQTC